MWARRVSAITKRKLLPSAIFAAGDTAQIYIAKGRVLIQCEQNDDFWCIGITTCVRRQSKLTWMIDLTSAKDVAYFTKTHS